MTILQPGPAPAVSFNDVTSLDGRLTTGFKVYIDAQVQEFEQLDWYFTLLQACPDIPGELESAVIRSPFEALPPEKRTRVWATLFRVKIHVVDPRPYQDFIDAMYCRHLQSDDAPQQVLAAALERRAWAVQMLEQNNIFITGSIPRDSTACRTRRVAKYIEDELTIALDPSGYDMPELLDLQDFKCGTKRLVKKAQSGLPSPRLHFTMRLIPLRMAWTTASETAL